MIFEHTPITSEVVVPGVPPFLRHDEQIKLSFIVELNGSSVKELYDEFPVGEEKDFDIKGHIIRGMINNMEIQPLSSNDDAFHVELSVIRAELVKDAFETWAGATHLPPPKPGSWKKDINVVCVSAIGLEDRFTEGGEYEARTSNSGFLTVWDDDGEQVEVFAERFTEKTEDDNHGL